MAAALVITPAGEIQVGDTLGVSGTGFLPNTAVTVTIMESGESFQQVSDAAGEINSDDLADKALATLTSDGVNVTAADTVTLGAVTYTFRASVTTTANEVLIGGSASASLDNLKSAVNLDGTAGVYGSLTAVHPTVGAGTKTATTIVFYAKTGGTAGNSLASTETSTHLSFGTTTFAGGAATTGVSPMLYKPQDATPLTIKATDGTNTATAHVTVATG